MSDLVEEGRLFAPEEVLKELEYQEDDLTDWAKKHRKMFVPPDYHQIAFLTEIARDFPQLAQSKVSANTADPFVIALAKVNGYIVVSEERRGSFQNPKIPQICAHYHVTHVPFLSILKAEGWTFR
jgi:phytoene/squalene synthetase